MTPTEFRDFSNSSTTLGREKAHARRPRPRPAGFIGVVLSGEHKSLDLDLQNILKPKPGGQLVDDADRHCGGRSTPCTALASTTKNLATTTSRFLPTRWPKACRQHWEG